MGYLWKIQDDSEINLRRSCNVRVRHVTPK